MNATDLDERRAPEILIPTMGRKQASGLRGKGDRPLSIFFERVLHILNVPTEI